MRTDNGNDFHFYLAVQTLARQASRNKTPGVKQNIQTMGVTEVCRHNLNCIIHTALLGPCRTVNLDSCSNKCCEFQPSSQITASSHRAMNISLKLLIGNTRTVLLAGLALTQKSAFVPQTKCDDGNLYLLENAQAVKMHRRLSVSQLVFARLGNQQCSVETTPHLFMVLKKV